MNDRKEQILKMAKIIRPVRPFDGCNMDFKCKYDFNEDIGCPECSIANALIKSGYGNVKQAVKEFAKKLKGKFDFILDDCFSVDGIREIRERSYTCNDIHIEINRLINELYGED